MTVQKLLLPKTEYPDMYFRGGAAVDEALRICGGEKVSFDTYFGCFSYPRYRDYTSLSGIGFKARIEGSARILLCSFDKNEVRTVAECEVCDGEAVLYARFDPLPECGILYPVIEAITDVRLTEGEYFTDAEGRDISCSVAICTFRREEALLKNLDKLSDYSFSHISRVIVVDNGNTLDRERTESELIRIYPNRNYGGSAGFTRGIIEAKRAGFSHVILMDDDVELYPDSLERMTVFASLLRDEYKSAHISAAMLYATRPCVQHELGARWDNEKIVSLKNGLDTRLRESLVTNMEAERTEYGAWWCFLLPLSDVESYGLPLPLFIKFDDVEYGMRTCASPDAPIVTLNGACVRHDDFDLKYSMHLEYYNIRNQLIMLILRKRRGRFTALSRLIKASVKHLFLYRYDAMDIILKAFDDLLRGAEHLMSSDAETLNSSLIKNAPKAVPLSDIPEWRPGMRDSEKPPRASLLKKLMMLLTLGGHLVPSFLLNKEAIAFPLPDAPPKSAFMRRVTIQYQLGSDYGYRLERSFGKFFAYAFKTLGMALKILFRYGRAKKSFLKQESHITSEAFWQDYLGLE